MELMKKQTIAAYRLAYTFPLFEYADDSGVIRACIIGSDPFCEEYMKAAVWSTQRDGFRLELDVFAEKGECARLQKLYPEVFCTEGLSDRHEIFCDVRLKSGAPCGSYGFAMTAGECYALSVNAAKAVIISDERAHSAHPDILRFTSQELSGGDFLAQSGIEKQALSLFCRFGGSAERFFRDEFSYRSSVASAMFWDIRRRQGESIEVCERNMRLEHRRWNAFTRTEGYRYGEKRSEQEKTHPCLVAWDMLSAEYRLYDAEPIRNSGLIS